MAHCLMQINQCGFPNCGQHFANQYDLTAHIEYTHIPMIEEDVKRKALAAANTANGDQSLPQPNNLPLSYYSRVFRTAYRPNPIKPEPLKVSFNHYKRRAVRDKQTNPSLQYHRIYREMMAKQGRNSFTVSLEDAERRLSDVDFEECGPENNEVRYRCQIVDCMKRFKSMFALRMHMKLMHAVSVSEDAKSLTNFPPEDMKPPTPSSHPQPNLHLSGPQQDNHVSSGSQSSLISSNTPNVPLAQSSPLPSVSQSFGNPATNSTSYKCSCCSKRYKTQSGLANHMMSSHQKISDIQDAPSPQVVEQLISQVRMQRQQQEQNDQNQQRGAQSTSQQQTLGSLLKNSSHARSYTVSSASTPSLRFSQQYQVNMDNQPSTGQILQMQLQHQRRIKQQQEQAAAAAAQQQQQQQIQQQQQQAPIPSHSSQQSNQHQQMQTQHQQHQQVQQQHQTVASHLAHGPQQFAPQQQQSMGPPMGSQMMQQQGQQGAPQQPLGSMQQQFHHMPMQQQQQSPYPQQMQHHQMNQQNTMQHHHYQQQNQFQHQQSPQFPYQQPSPHHHSAQQQQGPPQRSPIPLSQALPPLNSMTQQRSQMQPMPHPNSTQMHVSPPNQQRQMEHSGYGMMTSPVNGQHPQQQQHPHQQQHPQQQQLQHPPPPYNM